MTNSLSQISSLTTVSDCSGFLFSGGRGLGACANICTGFGVASLGKQLSLGLEGEIMGFWEKERVVWVRRDATCEVLSFVNGENCGQMRGNSPKLLSGLLWGAMLVRSEVDSLLNTRFPFQVEEITRAGLLG